MKCANITHLIPLPVAAFIGEFDKSSLDEDYVTLFPSTWNKTW
jgi:hypothetical protein